MSDNDMVGLIITILLGCVILAISIALILGRGSFLIAGYNTLPAAEKEKYDTKALCRFLGKILLPIGVFLPLVAVGGIFHIGWLPALYGFMVAALVIFALIYCNTKKRFRK